jgi:alpha-L-fucosidase
MNLNQRPMNFINMIFAKRFGQTAALLTLAFSIACATSALAADAVTRFNWFTAAKAGMFIHWGPYSVAGGEWQGQRGSRDAHLQNEFRIPMAEYGKLVKEFNPVKFDADAWVKLAKDAGLGYIVYVSKHHDGFAMFDSPANPYNMVAATPFGRDPLKELAASCKAQGLVLCVYYSLGRDWSVPGVPRGGNRCNDWDFPKPPADAQKSYIQNKVKPQLRELLTQYGPIGAVWFDTPDQITREHSLEIRDHIHSLQPDCLINARIGNGLGDYDIQEQKIPAAAIHRPWEACLTLNRRWGYDRNDNQWKSPEMIVRCLVDVASKGGNFLINIGPTGEGVVPEPSVDRPHALGEWMRVNGEAIRGTTASRIAGGGNQGVVFQDINPDGSEMNLEAGGAAKSLDVSLPRGWRSTSKPGCIYLHLFDRPASGLIRLNGIAEKVKRVTMLADPQHRLLDFQQTNGVFTVMLPEGVWDNRTTVLKVETIEAP